MYSLCSCYIEIVVYVQLTGVIVDNIVGMWNLLFCDGCDEMVLFGCNDVKFVFSVYWCVMLFLVYKNAISNCYFTMLCALCVAFVHCLWYHWWMYCSCSISKYINTKCLIIGCIENKGTKKRGLVLVCRSGCYFTMLCSLCVAFGDSFWYHCGLCCSCSIRHSINNKRSQAKEGLK